MCWSLVYTLKVPTTVTPACAPGVTETQVSPPRLQPRAPHRLSVPRLCSRITSENVAEQFGISREKQDTFALASQEK